jgi:hypothetical protein
MEVRAVWFFNNLAHRNVVFDNVQVSFFNEELEGALTVEGYYKKQDGTLDWIYKSKS